jgi:hypothetical protein
MTIDLATTDPRDYQREIERALTKGGHIAVAEALHGSRPRDLAEVLALLPDDVEIKLWEVADATH